jgi:hypothetical protein
MDKLGALIVATYQQPLAIGRDSGKAELQGTKSQLDRSGSGFAKQTLRVR